jgi:hypothetical protein
MTKREETLYHSLMGIRNEFSTVINELKRQSGIISTELIEVIDAINKLSVEV